MSVAGAAGLLVGCAYYNGLYNAKRWARQAERSELAGRTGEARERWQRAAIHAETLLARHPRSRWADDAMLLRGRALVALGRYGEAVVSLRQAVAATTEEPAQDEARLLLGRAYLAIGRTAAAETTLTLAATSRVRRVREPARLFLARTYLAQARPDEALAVLATTRVPEAALERVRAALALRDTALIRRHADSLALARYDERAWDGLLDSLERHGLADPARRLVDRLLARGDLRAGEQARLALADGRRRLAAGDSAAAAARFRATEALVPDSVEAREAEVQLVALAAARAPDEAALEGLRAPLRRIVALGGAPARDAQLLLRHLLRLDSLAEAAEFPDAWWFARGELARDSLGASRVAAGIFAAMGERWPESPWTPKGLVAAIAAGFPGADSLRAVLAGRYAGSPYAALVTGAGDQPEAFARLEDSLRVALTLRGPERETGPVVGDDIELRRGARPRPAPAAPRPVLPRPAPGGRPRPEP
jgi:outer membrane protein assembly factor BamD (BamD/ComL family)